MKARILIVDDDPVVRHILSTMLTSSGHEVRLLASGRECLDTLAADLRNNSLPDLLFLDLQLEIPGAQVLAEIRSLTEPQRHIPVVMLSGNTEKEVRQNFPDISMDRFLEKPFPAELVQGVVSELLGQD